MTIANPRRVGDCSLFVFRTRICHARPDRASEIAGQAGNDEKTCCQRRLFVIMYRRPPLYKDDRHFHNACRTDHCVIVASLGHINPNSRSMLLR